MQNTDGEIKDNDVKEKREEKEENNNEKTYWDEDVLRIKNEVRRYEAEQHRLALGLPAEDEEVSTPAEE